MGPPACSTKKPKGGERFFGRPFRLVFQPERQHVRTLCRARIPPQRSPGTGCVNAIADGSRSGI
jgi:hypothetical protein